MSFTDAYAAHLQEVRKESPDEVGRALDELYRYGKAMTEVIRRRKPPRTDPLAASSGARRRSLALDAQGRVKLRAFLPLGEIKRPVR